MAERGVGWRAGALTTESLQAHTVGFAMSGKQANTAKPHRVTTKHRGRFVSCQTPGESKESRLFRPHDAAA